MTAAPTPMLKVSVLHYRDQSQDEGTFIKWWNEEHMPTIMPIALRHGIERVELYVTSSSFKQRFQQDLQKLKGGSAAGWNMAPYDAASIYWTTDFQNIRNMLNDPDWEAKVTGSAEGWLDTSKADVQVGTQTTFIDNGKVVNNATKKSTALSLI
ncbi:hypothetical protein Daus18300_010710 [Diaporthe australafricana]|uniref:EthD domain-containing protein n=1 Tax=Diaporthe australafricana TaxID=127596 RepID=A0ABR3W961_9PEZI